MTTTTLTQTVDLTQTLIDRGLLYDGGFKWASSTITYSIAGYVDIGSSQTPVYYNAKDPKTGKSLYSTPDEPRNALFGTLSETIGQVYDFTVAMGIWDSYIAPSLSLVRDTTMDGVTGDVGNIRIAFSSEPGGIGIGYTPPPPNTAASPSQGDIWLDAALKGQSLDQGTSNFQGLLHEAGHALGLQHSFAGGDKNASYVTGQNGENYNTHIYTLMSYNPVEYTKTFTYTNTSTGYSYGFTNSPVNDLTPMVLDIQAIQDLYGRDLATGSGNDTYTFTDASFNGRRSLYDASGTDTLDFSQISRGSHIDLRPGAYSDINYFSQADQIEAAVAQGGEKLRTVIANYFISGSPTYEWKTDFAIAFSTVIENVIGTAKADTIIGNTAANVITGGAGADTISGGGGKDIFRDTAANLNGDTITDFITSNLINVTDATGALQNLTYTSGTLSFSLPGASGTTYTMTVNGATGAVQQKADAAGGVDIYFGTGTLPAPTYSIAVGATSVLEGSNYKGNSLTYTVTRTSADSAASVDVVFTGTAQSTAKYGLDFTTSGLDGGNRLSFAAGALTATFAITTVGDATQETNESIITTIANATDGTIGTASVKINILDDDGPGGISGKVIDGYIVGATVFADTNGNGVLDPGEASAVTGSEGAFTLAAAVGPLLATGGIDSSTGLPVTYVMAAPDGATVITPLTTIAQALAKSGASDPIGSTLAAFGLPSSFDLIHTDALEAMESGVLGAVQVTRAGAMAADTLLLIAAGLKGAGASVSAANASAISAIASYVASHGPVDLTHADVVTAIASSTGLSALVASTIGSVAAASNTTIAASTNIEDESLGTLQLNAQQNVASAIVAAGSDPTKLAGIFSIASPVVHANDPKYRGVASNNLAYSSTANGPSHTIDLLNFEASFPDLIQAFGTNQQAAQSWYNTYESKENRVETFDGLDYVASYGDLVNAFSSAGSLKAVQDAGASHYITYGVNEGRTTSFNGLDYIASYADLRKAFGADNDTGAYHFIESGVGEGRTTTFDGLDYIASYGDLIKAFGANEQAGAAHFITSGANEARTTTFNGLDYIASYGDLIKAFGANNDAGATHFIQSGSAEGRTTTFDGLDYIASYGDLIKALGTNEQAGAAHFITNGANEGRTTTFDGLAYIAQYGDLMNAFGANNDAGATHYIQSGAAEGRTTGFNVAAYEQAHPDLVGKFASNDAFLTAYIGVYKATGTALT